MSGPDQKVAVITGGSQGIGAGLVAGYRQLGWAVVASARRMKPSDDPDLLAVDPTGAGAGPRRSETAPGRRCDATCGCGHATRTQPHPRCGWAPVAPSRRPGCGRCSTAAPPPQVSGTCTLTSSATPWLTAGWPMDSKSRT